MDKKMIFALYFLLTTVLFCQWSDDPNINLQITNWGDNPISTIEDGLGGAFVTLGFSIPVDTLPYSQKRPYLIHINRSGNHELDTAIYLGGYGSKISDGKLIQTEDGLYIYSYIDELFALAVNARIYYQGRVRLQKFDSLGNTFWDQGIDVSVDPSLSVGRFEIIADLEGGCYVYYDAIDTIKTSRAGRRLLQHIDKNGARLWGDNGIEIFKGDITWTVYSQSLCFFKGNGLLVHYNGDEVDTSYLAFVDLEGNILWRTTSRVDVYGSKKIPLDNSIGILGFSMDPVTYSKKMRFDKIGLEGNYLTSPNIILDSLQYAKRVEWLDFINDSIQFIWLDEPENNHFNSYFQNLDLSGQAGFDNYGIIVLDSTHLFRDLVLDEDSVIIISDFIAQKIDLNGNSLWQNSMIEYTNRNMTTSSFVGDNSNGFIVFWHEGLGGAWGQQVSKYGILGQILTSVKNSPSNLRANFKLYQNYPNPFNPETKISFQLLKPSEITLEVTNVLGQRVAVLMNGVQKAGNYEINFDGNNLSSGIYFYRLAADGFVSSKKMTLLK